MQHLRNALLPYGAVSFNLLFDGARFTCRAIIGFNDGNNDVDSIVKQIGAVVVLDKQIHPERIDPDDAHRQLHQSC